MKKGFDMTHFSYQAGVSIVPNHIFKCASDAFLKSSYEATDKTIFSSFTIITLTVAPVVISLFALDRDSLGPSA